MTPYLALAISIASEITATLSLKASEGLTRPLPVILVVAGYGCAFWLMSSALQALPVGFVYAVWSGIGMVGAALGGLVLFDETVNRTMLVGIVVVMLGVTILAYGQGSGGGTAGR